MIFGNTLSLSIIVPPNPSSPLSNVEMDASPIVGLCCTDADELPPKNNGFIIPPTANFEKLGTSFERTRNPGFGFPPPPPPPEPPPGVTGSSLQLTLPLLVPFPPFAFEPLGNPPPFVTIVSNTHQYHQNHHHHLHHVILPDHRTLLSTFYPPPLLKIQEIQIL